MRRRDFLHRGVAALLLGPVTGGLSLGQGFGSESAGVGPGASLSPIADPRLRARPGTPRQPPPRGKVPLGLARGRDGHLIVPRGYDHEEAAPLVVLLHGGSGSADRMFMFEWIVDRFGVCLLVPSSRHRTWDRIRDDFGPDVRFLDEALAFTFDRCRIDPRRIALAGFSDGASYALSLGVSNGELFTHLMAMSPGHIDADRRFLAGRPRVFVSHGDADRVLPVELSRERIVPDLRADGYDVTWHEFAGGHDPSRTVTQAAMEWFLAQYR